jgi:O-antigen ligase
MSEATLTRWISRGLLVLIALMGVHAFLSVWLGSLLGHENLIQSWKEALLIVLGIATVYLLYLDRNHLKRLQNNLVYTIAGYTFWSLLVTLIANISLSLWVFGAKTNLVFLVAFMIALVVSSPKLINQTAKLMVIVGAAVAAFGVIQVVLLPADFLVHFGYGEQTVKPYLTLGTGTTIRIISTLGGPNQLGSYLILPLCILTALIVKRFRWWQPVIGLAMLFTLFHTFSRSAWIGAIVGMVITALVSLPRKQALWLGGALAVVALLGALIFPRASTDKQWQYYLLHTSAKSYNELNTSDTERLIGQQRGIDAIKARPLGHGLGTAGPASFHSAKPLITENYYLQLGIEAGLIGLALFLAVSLLLGWQLWGIANAPLAAACLGTLIGVSIVNLFLHGWADSSTALTFWTVAGIAVGGRT